MEGAILLALQTLRIGGLTQLMALVSALGNSALIWIVLGLVLLVFQERRQGGLILIVTVLLTMLACALISNAVGRPCPIDDVTGLVPVMGVSRAGYSFPSAHAAVAFAAFTVLWRSGFWGLGSAAFVFALLESFSRLYLGVSYPTDVLAGIAVGLALAFIIYSLLSRLLSLIDLQPPKPERKQVKGANRGRHSL